MSIYITPRAADQIFRQGAYLRITVKSGGCSGLRTLFSFEKELSETDQVTFWEGSAAVVVDPLSFLFIQEATVDYVEELMASQFVLTHSKAIHACSCGSSFSVS